jgi:hypothetical protein
MRFLRSARKTARATVAGLDRVRSRYSHIVVETRDRQTGFALAGGLKARHLFRRLYLDATAETQTRHVVHRAATADTCRALVQRYGLVVFCGDSAPPALVPELLPIPVLLEMDLPAPSVLEGPPAGWSHSVKDDVRRVRRNGFDYDIQPGSQLVPEFYARMFRPTILNRHGAEAYLDSQHRIAQYARQPGAEVLRVLHHGKWVAGCLNVATTAGYRLLKLGWVQGDDAVLRAGVVGALYWFTLRRAAELGSPRVFLGPVTPYLEDGVLRYKSKWGATLSAGGNEAGEFRLLLDPGHAACRRFLRTHSFVVRGAGQELIVFSGSDPDTIAPAPELLSGIARWYRWRDEAAVRPAIGAGDVPLPLRPWVDQVLPASDPSR